MSENEKSLPIETHVELVSPEPISNAVDNHEKAAFVRYVQDQGQAIPANFKSADDWFNSLLEARKGYTQSRQEIANLKKQYNSSATANPNYKEPGVAENTVVVKTEEPKLVDLSGIPDELKIQPHVVENNPNPVVSQADWMKWGGEIDRNGALSEVTKKEIKDKMGVDDVVVDQMVKGRQALQKESFSAAASVVGGADELKGLFAWAQKSLPAEEISAINRALQTSAYPNVLLGLRSRMQALTPASAAPVNREPQVQLNRVNSSQVSQQVQVFNSQIQQNAAISDPRFRTDPNFRRSVESMIVNSSKYGFKDR